MEETLIIKFVSWVRWTQLLCVLAVAFMAAAAQAQPVEPAMVVIAHQATSEEAIPRASLRAIFGMLLQKWPSNTPVKVFVFSDDAPEHATFSKSVLQVFPHQLRMAWDRQVFSGQGQYPESVGSTARRCWLVWRPRQAQSATSGRARLIRMCVYSSSLGLVFALPDSDALSLSRRRLACAVDFLDGDLSVAWFLFADPGQYQRQQFLRTE
jgi:hypothetical protein